LSTASAQSYRVFDGVFNNRLERKSRKTIAERGGFDFRRQPQAVSEPQAFEL
jgi:hypothetical protein